MLGFNKKTQDASPQENTGGENKVFHFIKTHKKRCIAVVAAAAVLVAVIVPRKSRSASADLAYTQEKLGRRDIVNVYDGSGTINAADSYTVKSLVTGTVLTADFELGDSIEKGDILYTIDISDVENNLASAQLSVEQAQRNYDDIADMQNVRTRISGEVSSFAVAAGDAVQAGQAVATIRDTSVMLLAVDFPAAEAQSFAVGQAAQVMPDTTFETLNGTIRSVSGADPAGDASLMTCTVTIAVPNAGSLTTAQAAVAQVNGVSSSTLHTLLTSVRRLSWQLPLVPCLNSASRRAAPSVRMTSSSALPAKIWTSRPKTPLTACALPSCRCLLPRRPSATIPSTPRSAAPSWIRRSRPATSSAPTTPPCRTSAPSTI